MMFSAQKKETLDARLQSPNPLVLPTSSSNENLQTSLEYESNVDDLTPHEIVNFSWENLTYRVPVEDDDGSTIYKTLLHNLSGTALGGRVLAIMGPSGAGKTSLMSAITGKLNNASAQIEGCCFLNQTIYSQRYKKLVSYVAQDDIVMGKETPREAIRFACRVRLGLSNEESEKRVDEVIRRLHLEKCQQTIFGIPGVLKGISGGERKRASVGVELVTNPHIVLLDEPTTGLDSVNALRVGELLRDLARNDKRTVIAVVHSPSSELFDLFDDLLLLAKGHVIYHGPSKDSIAYFAGLGYALPPRTNPSEYYMNLLRLPEPQLSKLWRAWEDYANSREANSNECLMVVQGPITHHNDYLEKQLDLKGADCGVKFVELWKRSLRIYLRDPTLFIARVVQTLSYALIMGLFFFNLKLDQDGVRDRIGALYVTLINNLIFSVFFAVAAFASEKIVFLHEQEHEAYNAYVYFASKYLAEMPFQILFATVYDLILYFLVNFDRSFYAFTVHWLILLLFYTVSCCFGFMIASIVSSFTLAHAIVPLVLLPLSIAAGLFASSERLETYWIWLRYISFPRYAYMGVFVNEFGRIGVICNPVTPECTYADGQAVIREFGFEGWHYWMSIMALIMEKIVICLIAATSLYVQSRRCRKRLVFADNLSTRCPRHQSTHSSESSSDTVDFEPLLHRVEIDEESDVENDLSEMSGNRFSSYGTIFVNGPTMSLSYSHCMVGT